MKKFIRIWFYPLAIMGVLLMLTSTCKKDEEVIKTIPVLTTTAVSEISFNTAICGGIIASDGGAAITVRGVCWSKKSNPTISDSITNNGSGSGSFTSILTELNDNTNYYVRAYAINSAGTGYGKEITFTTPEEEYTPIGFAVGDNGTILKTVDEGITWTAQQSGTSYNLTSVFFIDRNIGYAVGEIHAAGSWGPWYSFGIILKTTNGGDTWNVLLDLHELECGLQSVFFTDANRGFVVGGRNLKTINGGLTWSVLSIQASGTVNSIYFTDVNTGFVVDNGGTIFKTINGGDTWTDLSGGNNPLNSIFFNAANIGYAVDESGTIIKTDNGGESWTGLSSGTLKCLNSVYFIDANTGYVSGGGETWGGAHHDDGNGGIILKTTNGGTTWNTFSTAKPVLSMYFFDFNTGYVVGCGGAILKTIDGGITWNALSSGTTATLNSIYFIKAK